MFHGSEDMVWTNTNKMFLGLEDIIQKNTHWHFQPSLWPYHNFPQDSPAYDAVLSNQVWLQTDQKFRRYNRNSYIWSYKPLLWPWLWTQWTNFSAWHSGLRCCITIPGLVTKCSVVQKILSRQTFPNILNLCCDFDLECSNPFFFHKMLWFTMMYHQTKYCKRISSSEETVIFRSYEPSLWPWPRS